MKRLLISVLFLLCGAICFAQSQATPSDVAGEFTNGFLNGRFWSLSSENEKYAWVVGYIEGAKVFAPAKAMIPKGLTPEEISRSIDHFYETDTENVRVPLHSAIDYVSLKAAGTPQDALDKISADFRKRAAKQ